MEILRNKTLHECTGTDCNVSGGADYVCDAATTAWAKPGTDIACTKVAGFCPAALDSTDCGEGCSGTCNDATYQGWRSIKLYM